MGLQVYGLLLSERPAVRIRLRTLFQKMRRSFFHVKDGLRIFHLEPIARIIAVCVLNAQATSAKGYIPEMPFRWALFLKIAINAEFRPYKKALSLIFALQIRESAFVLLTMRLLSQRIRSTPNSEKIIRQPSLFQHYALIGAQRVGGVGVVTQQFLGIGPAYGQGLGNFPLPQVAENQQLRLAVVPAIG